MEEDLQTKQQYLRSEIIDQGYDPSDFNFYMCSIRQEENIDLNNWTLEQLKDVVESFKESMRNAGKEEEEIGKEENEQNAQENEQNVLENEQLNIEEAKTNNNNTQNNENENINKNKSNVQLQSRNTVKSLEVHLNQKGNDAFDDFEKIVPCTKLEKNELTYRDDLYITISDPVKINPGFFSFSYFQYTVKTFPLYFNVLRKVSDFIFLSQKLPLIHPVVYIPSLPHFQYGLKDDSPKKIRYLQNYMNLLIENKFVRTLPIFYDFLTLPQQDLDNKVKNKYRKIKEPPTGFETMPNFEGKYVLKITKEDEIKASKIKNEINSKNEKLVNLNSNLDELLVAMEKVSTCFKNVGLSFTELQKKTESNLILNKGYENLSNLFQTWSNDYLLQRTFIKDEIKYYFKFINKEYTSFLKNYENYRLARDEYKRTFERMKKNKNPTDEDLFLLKDIKKYYAFELIHINDEYIKLEERQGKRLIKQFVKYYDNKDVIFQDFQKCCHLLQFQEYYVMNEKRYKLENYNKEFEEEEKKNNEQKENNIQEENNIETINNEQKENNIQVENNIENNNNEQNNNNNEENIKDNEINNNKINIIEENLEEKNIENNKKDIENTNHNTNKIEENKDGYVEVNNKEKINDNIEKKEIEKVNPIEDDKENNKEVLNQINGENKNENNINIINKNEENEENKEKEKMNENKEIKEKNEKEENIKKDDNANQDENIKKEEIIKQVDNVNQDENIKKEENIKQVEDVNQEENIKKEEKIIEVKEENDHSQQVKIEKNEEEKK